jgi:biopolymer transport protein ExbD
MPLKTQLDEQPALNLTPMIDVLFLLIIFFMVGTQFVRNERHIKLSVPTVGQFKALPAPHKSVVINVHGDGMIELDGKPYSLDALTSALSLVIQQDAHVCVTVRGDAAGPLQNIATVLTACRQAGIRDMGLSVKVDRKLR